MIVSEFDVVIRSQPLLFAFMNRGRSRPILDFLRGFFEGNYLGRLKRLRGNSEDFNDIR